MPPSVRDARTYLDLPHDLRLVRHLVRHLVRRRGLHRGLHDHPALPLGREGFKKVCERVVVNGGVV